MHLAHYGVERRRHRRLPAGKDLHDGLVVAQRTGLTTLESIEYSLPGVGVTQVLHDHARCAACPLWVGSGLGLSIATKACLGDSKSLQRRWPVTLVP